ncbi:MAG: helix-turn-helix domain-containing protein [Frankiaceae bacterium]
MTDGLGRRIVGLRRRAGLSQAGLAEAAHITSAYVAMLERGHRSRPSDAVLRSLAAVLDTTVGWLVTGRDGEAHPHEVDQRFGEVALRNGDAAAARERFAAAYEDAVALGDGYVPEQREAQYGMARADWTLGRINEAIAGFEALLRADDLPSSVRRVKVQTWLCRAYTHAGDLSRAIELGEDALREVGSLDSAVFDDGVVLLASTLVEAYYQRGDLTRAQQLIDATVVAAEAAGSLEARGAACWSAATVAEARGEVRAAIQYADRALALYGELGRAFDVAALRGNAAAYSLRLPDTDLDAAEALLRESIDGLAAAAHTGPADLAEIEKELARCLLLSGRVDKAVDIARAALDRVPSAPLERARVLAVLAAALLASGREEEALAAYQDAALALEAWGAGRQAAPVWSELADVLSAMGRESDAKAALRRMGTALGVPAVPVRPRPTTAPT